MASLGWYWPSSPVGGGVMVVGGGGWVQWREVAGWGAESKVERAGAGRRRQVEGRVRPFDDDGSNGAEVLQRFLRWRLRNGVWSWSWGHCRATRPRELHRAAIGGR